MEVQTAGIVLDFAVILYCMSMAGYLLFLFNQKSVLQKISFYLISGAVAVHLASIAAYTLGTGALPVQNLSQNLSVAAFALGIMFLFFQYKYDLKILGVFAAFLLSAMMVAVILIPEAHGTRTETLKGIWLYLHVILVFTGEASLALACGTGILYLLQEKGIKSKAPGFFFKRLPSLDLLDNVGYACLTTGFALLTMGLVTGFVYAKIIWGRFWSWDVKEVFSVATWLVYAAVLHLRLYSGWRGKKSAVMTIIGFLVIVFTFLGVNMLLGGHHQGFTR